MILLSSWATFLRAELDRVWEVLPSVFFASCLFIVCPALPNVWHHRLPGPFSLRTFRNLLGQNGALPLFSNSGSTTERSLQKRGRTLRPAVMVLPRGASLRPCREKDAKSPQRRTAQFSSPDRADTPAPHGPVLRPSLCRVPSSRSPVWALPTGG